MRCLWMLEEVGRPYQLVEKTTRADDLQTAEYMRLNPNARIPTLVDGDLVLWESMAINLYLAQKYDGPMHCADPKVLGLAAQWSFWAMLEIERLLLELLEHRVLLPEYSRDASVVERVELLLRKPLTVLNGALAGCGFLAGDAFTVADLNVAGILIELHHRRLIQGQGQALMLGAMRGGDGHHLGIGFIRHGTGRRRKSRGRHNQGQSQKKRTEGHHYSGPLLLDPLKP